MPIAASRTSPPRSGSSCSDAVRRDVKPTGRKPVPAATVTSKPLDIGLYPPGRGWTWGGGLMSIGGGNAGIDVGLGLLIVVCRAAARLQPLGLDAGPVRLRAQARLLLAHLRLPRRLFGGLAVPLALAIQVPALLPSQAFIRIRLEGFDLFEFALEHDGGQAVAQGSRIDLRGPDG